MKQINYMSVKSISLKSTGLLSSSSDTLIEFIDINKMWSVGTFLELMDNNLFEHSTYRDTMIEARGLADLLKYKYFDTLLVSDDFLTNPIENIVFQIPAGEYEMYGITDIRKKKTTIYTVLSRLGFSDKERDLILSNYSNMMYGRKLIDIFQEIYDNLYGKDKLTEIEEVFFNKILIYISYYEHKQKNEFHEKKIMEQMCTLLNELGDLYDTRDKLDKKINDLENSVFELDVMIKRGNK